MKGSSGMEISGEAVNAGRKRDAVLRAAAERNLWSTVA